MTSTGTATARSIGRCHRQVSRARGGIRAFAETVESHSGSVTVTALESKDGRCASLR